MSRLKQGHAFFEMEQEKTKGDSEITIPAYIRHHVFGVENGHDIIIVSGDVGHERLMKIKCRWPKDKNPRTKPFTHE